MEQLSIPKPKASSFGYPLLIIACFFSLVSISASHFIKNKYSEQQKIEYLLTKLESLRYSEVRNAGQEIPAPKYARKLSKFYNKYQRNIESADEFIMLVSRPSRLTGLQDELIRKNGSRISINSYLTSQLSELK